MVQQRQDVTRVTLAVLFIGGLLLSSAWVLLPFLPAIIWALTLVIATWPLMIWTERHAGNRRSVAVLVMTIVLLLVLILPLWLAITMIVDNVGTIKGLIQSALTFRLPAAPEWLDRVPVVGARISETWTKMASASIHELAPTLDPYAGAAAQWFLSTAGSLGGMFLHFLLTTAIAAVMYAHGELGAATAIRFGRRLAGDRGEMVVRLAGQAIRGVALGVVVTAVAQSALGGIGLLIVGIPFASVLTAVMFILCLIQIGPGLVLIPAVIWMYYSGEVIWATVLLAFTLVAATMDGFLRPYLIRKGADLPLLLIFAGVIGGLVAFGMLGIFVGPTLLATAYTLLQAWMAETDAELKGGL
ncbi:AI-2E family transporter YdiK [Phyllobacterium endophyticum]|nr:AI-2E family transporter YdiK [Phyllobacterium endophyticum]